MPGINERRKHRRARYEDSKPEKENVTSLKSETIFLIAVVFILITGGAVAFYLSARNADDGDDDPVFYKITLDAYFDDIEIEPDGKAGTVLIVENRGDTAEYKVSFDKPDNWTAGLDTGRKMELKDGSKKVMVLDVGAPAGQKNGTYEVTVNFSAAERSELYWMFTFSYRVKSDTDERISENGDTLHVQYTGMLIAGEVFDTSLDAVDRNDDIPKTDSYREGERDGTPLGFTLGEKKMIAGFEEGSYGRQVGETFVIVVPPEKGYTQEGQDLYGKTLIFVVNLESMEEG